jgi:imidazoleglycerol-phosphate dehydratase
VSPRRSRPAATPSARTRAPARFRRALAATWRFHDAADSLRREPAPRGVRRGAVVTRRTAETRIRCAVTLDGRGTSRIATGIGFLDHLLAALAAHGRLDLALRARGDLHVDQHHTVEDVGLVLGRALHEALGDARGIRRTGCFLFPMDEAIGYAAVDLCGRGSLVCDVPLRGAAVGTLQADVVEDFVLALARELRAAVHLVVPRARSDHHALEAAFKALGKALREACARDPRGGDRVPSTKGTLDG